MRRRNPLVGAAATLLIAFGTYACDSERVNAVLGIPALTPSPAIDFGNVLTDTSASRTVTIWNNGPAPLDVISVDVVGSTALHTDFPAGGLTIAARSKAQLLAVYAPVTDGALTGTRIVVGFDHAYVSSGGSTLSLDVTGRAVSGCAIEPAATEFGTIAINSKSSRAITLLNPTPVAWTVTVGNIVDSAGAFEFSGGPDAALIPGPGTYSVPAATVSRVDGSVTPGARTLAIDFRPDKVGDYEATIPLVAPRACALEELKLGGTAVRDVLQASPQVDSTCELDFGFVSLGATARASVRIENIGTERSVHVSNLRILESPWFELDPALKASAAFDLDHGAGANIPILFAPEEVGRQTALLAYTEDKDPQPRSCVLRGFGGGPRATVTPTSIDFGHFAVDNMLERSIVVANDGTGPGGDADAANLLFAYYDIRGWHIAEPTLEGPDAADFALVRPVQMLQTGIPVDSFAKLGVRFAPHSAGSKQATLVIRTNDPQAAAIRVGLSGSAELLAPCDFEVNAPINFGEISPGEQSELGLVVRNRSTLAGHSCLLRDAAIAGSEFEFVNPPTEPVVIAPGASATFRIRFTPPAQGSYSGNVHFTVSNPLQPDIDAMLIGQCAESCVTVLPDNGLLFGETPLNCGTSDSGRQGLTIVNGCTQQVRVEGIDVAASSEFVLVSAPPFPQVLAPRDSASASFAYDPTDFGLDVGRVTVRVTTGLTGTPVPHTFVRSLEGDGQPNAHRTEVFLTARPKVDVLFIIDNSASMRQHQADLAVNFNALMTYLGNTDYHLAVTTTSVGAGYENGQFVPVSGSGPRVITPNMSPKSPADVFATNVQVGTSGDSHEHLLEPMQLALSNPLIGRQNAGFLRDDASLAVVVVSDAGDEYDQTSIDSYKNFLITLKGGDREKVAVAGIVPTFPAPPAGSACTYEDGRSAVGGERVRKLADAFEGPVRDICLDVSTAFSDVARYLVGYKTQFTLQRPADTSAPIEVSLNGIPFPRLGSHGETAWHYEPPVPATAQAPAKPAQIVFDVAAEPAFGDVVSVNYTVACN